MNQTPKPGCWGFAVTYSVDDPVCVACSFKDSCGPASLETRSRLEKLLVHRASVHGVPKLKSVAKQSESIKICTSDTTEKKIMEEKEIKVNAVHPLIEKPASPFFNKKADHYAHRLAAKGINLKQAVHTKTIPTSGVAKFIPVGIQHVIDNNGVDKKKLTAELSDKLTWTKGTSASHVSILVALFYGLGIIGSDCALLPANEA